MCVKVYGFFFFSVNASPRRPRVRRFFVSCVLFGVSPRTGTFIRLWGPERGRVRSAACALPLASGRHCVARAHGMEI